MPASAKASPTLRDLLWLAGALLVVCTDWFFAQVRLKKTSLHADAKLCHKGSRVKGVFVCTILVQMIPFWCMRCAGH